MSKPSHTLLLQVPESPRLLLAPARFTKSMFKSQGVQHSTQPEALVRLYLTVKR